MNKKIRYAMGAVGAVPALAMIPVQLAAPAAHAGKTAAATGKMVRTIYARDTAFTATTPSIAGSGASGAAVPQNTGPQACTPRSPVTSAIASSSRGHFEVTIFTSPAGCVVEGRAVLNFIQPRRLLRTRFNKSGHTFQAPLTSSTGTFHGETLFSTFIVDHKGASVCVALVNQNSIHQVTNGPICFHLPV
jgi:hypothetical protein